MAHLRVLVNDICINNLIQLLYFSYTKIDVLSFTLLEHLVYSLSNSIFQVAILSVTVADQMDLCALKNISIIFSSEIFI